MLGFAVLVLVVDPAGDPAAEAHAAAPPVPQHAAAASTAAGRRIGGHASQLVQALLCIAGFCCCIPMSMPQAHLVAFCSDIGISPTRSAAMLSVMLAAAFLARQAWGALADRIGGLRTVLAGSACQAVAITAFSAHPGRGRPVRHLRRLRPGLRRHHPGLLGRHPRLFPPSEASWRMPLTLFTAMSGMAFGSWFAGLLYDHFGFYAPAFFTGIAFNVANLLIIGFLVFRLTGGRWANPYAAVA